VRATAVVPVEEVSETVLLLKPVGAGRKYIHFTVHQSRSMKILFVAASAAVPCGSVVGSVTKDMRRIIRVSLFGTK
jgi:hypothetical protein